MTTKTISITNEAYSILKSRKNGNESFSEAIVRLSGKKSLSSFFGALNEKSADKLEKSISFFRKKHRISYDRRIGR